MVITKTNTHAGPPLGSRWAQKWAYMWAEQLVRFWYMLPKVTQAMSKLRVAPVERFLLYISACQIAKIISLVLLTYFLIRVLGEMCIIYASAMHMCILIYDFNHNLS